MRVLSFIFAFVATLGLVAALPAPNVGVTQSVNPQDSFQHATTSLTPVQKQLSAFCLF